MYYYSTVIRLINCASAGFWTPYPKQFVICVENICNSSKISLQVMSDALPFYSLQNFFGLVKMLRFIPKNYVYIVPIPIFLARQKDDFQLVNTFYCQALNSIQFLVGPKKFEPTPEHFGTCRRTRHKLIGTLTKNNL